MDEVMNDWYPFMSTHFANVNIITDGTSFSISGLWTITVFPCLFGSDYHIVECCGYWWEILAFGLDVISKETPQLRIGNTVPILIFIANISDFVLKMMEPDFKEHV